MPNQHDQNAHTFNKINLIKVQVYVYAWFFCRLVRITLNIKGINNIDHLKFKLIPVLKMKIKL